MKPPKYRRHPNGQAVVEHRSIPTKDHRLYLGPYGSEESLRRYRELLARLEAGESPLRLVTRGAELDGSIDELILLYLDFAKKYYIQQGKPTSEAAGMKSALMHLSELYGSDSAGQFGPKSLFMLQQHLIKLDYARTMVNKTINRIKRFFRWCAKHEYVPALLPHGLEVVDPILPGRFGAREPDPILPVKWDTLMLVVPHVAPQVAAMMQVQYLCGMRPQDATGMRRCDIDTSSDVWLYRPEHHKRSWAGRPLVKAIPSAAQQIVTPFFGDDPKAYLFSPRAAWEWHRDQKSSKRNPDRKTPIYPSELRARARRKAAARQHEPARPKGERYTTDSYRRAIEYGIKVANREIRARLAREGRPCTEQDLVPFWSPNQLRHGIATEIRQTLGQQAAQLWLGHESLETTNIYAEKETAELIEIARQLDRRWAS